MIASVVAERPSLDISIAQIATHDALFEPVINLRYQVLEEPLNLVRQSGPTPEDCAASTQHFVALCGQRVVGAVRLQQERGIIYGLSRIAVAPDMQRRGIGKQLVTEAEQMIYTSGGRVVQLLARGGSEPFYKQLTYDYTGRGLSRDMAYFQEMIKILRPVTNTVVIDTQERAA